MSSHSEKENIVIIGGGIIGCTTAYYLTRHPSFNPARHTITLLEATKIAGGASGKAGGLLAIWAYPSNIVGLSFRLHSELAKEHNGVERWGYRRIRAGQLVAKGREISGLMSPGEGPTVSLGKRKNKATEKSNSNNRIPSDLDWFSAESLEDYEEIGDTSTTAQVHPFQFTTAMAKLAEEKGANITLGSVQEIHYADGSPPLDNPESNGGGASPTHSDTSQSSDKKKVTAVTYVDRKTSETHTIPASTVVLAAGPWTPTLFPAAPVSCLRAHSITIRPTEPVSAYCFFTEIALPSTPGTGRMTRRPGTVKIVTPEIYARPNNEVYVCGEGDVTVPLPPTSDMVEVSNARCQEIVDAVGSVSDQLRDGVVTGRRACYLPTINTGGSGGPLIGPTGVDGLLLATGHSCWGIQNAPATGMVVSEIVFEGKAKSADIRSLDPRRML